jgi:hypothetical protein
MKKYAKDYTDAVKLYYGCAICGYNKYAEALVFDHINPETKYRTRRGKVVHIADMAKGNRYSLATIRAEIEKCRVLCANCHMVYTYTVQRKNKGE